MAKKKDEVQDAVAEVAEVKETAEVVEEKVEEAAPVVESVAEEPIKSEEPAPEAEPVVAEKPAKKEEPKKETKKETKKEVKAEPKKEEPKKEEPKKVESTSGKAYIVNSIPAYMAPNVNAAFGLISGLFVADAEVVNGAGLSFTGGYTSTPGAGSKVKVYVRTSDLA